jgi:hypothetical protein
MLILVRIDERPKQTIKVINSLHKKKVYKKAKVFIAAGHAKVAPPISSILGQFGINLLDFCDKFNSKTRHMNGDLICLVFVTVYSNKSFSFIIKPLSMNDLFFSFQLEDSIKDKDLFTMLFYKIYLVFSHSRDSNLLSITQFSVHSLNMLKQLIGYAACFPRIKLFFTSKNVIKKD